MVEWMADHPLYLLSFNSQPWSWGSTAAGFNKMLISLLMLNSLIVLSVEKIHLLLAEVFQGWFSFWFGWWTFCIWLHWYLCFLGNCTGDKQFVPRDRWHLVGLLQTHLTVTMHLYKHNFVQRFCRLFLSRFRRTCWLASG